MISSRSRKRWAPDAPLVSITNNPTSYRQSNHPTNTTTLSTQLHHFYEISRATSEIEIMAPLFDLPFAAEGIPKDVAMRPRNKLHQSRSKGLLLRREKRRTQMEGGKLGNLLRSSGETQAYLDEDDE